MLNIICEIANGYYGSLKISKKYIDMAKRAGANAVKFQIAYADEMLHPKDQIFEIIKNNEMSLLKWQNLRQYSKKNKINFYLDVDGEKAFEVAKKINPDAVKVHTTSFFDKRLISNCLFSFKKIYISISGIIEEEVDNLYSYLLSKKMNRKVIFLFGHQNAPTKIEDINLSRLIYFQKKYKKIEFGFMDHISGSSEYKYSLSIFALGLGFKNFEKHLTISRKQKLIDSISALEEKEFNFYVKSLKDHLLAIGKHNKKLTNSEKKYRNNALTVLHAKTEIMKNQKITYNNITHKRPLNYSSKHIVNPDIVIGKIANSIIKKNHPFKTNQLK